MRDLSGTDQLIGRQNGKLKNQLALIRLAGRHTMSHASAASFLPELDEVNSPKPRILLVDDNGDMLEILSLVLEDNGFEVAVAANVNAALKLIASEKFDVLLSDLQMPDAGDGLTVVSAMRHSNPKAVTFILSGYPQMDNAAKAILLQMDEVLTKPISPDLLVKAINDRLRLGAHPIQRKEEIATILEKETNTTISNWLQRIDAEPEIISVRLTSADRTAHLPELFSDLVDRLRHPLPLGTRALKSIASEKHGLLRREQGYTAAMLVEESRMLQVSIFETLQKNLHKVNFSILLSEVMVIADEVDSQLAQAMTSYICEAKTDNQALEP